MTKQAATADGSARPVDPLSQTEIEISPEMIEAGTAAFDRAASYDGFSLHTREEIVRLILCAALAHQAPLPDRSELTVPLHSQK